MDNIAQAEQILEHSFADKSLLLRALTHPSAADGDTINNSYERLEFLGDSILGAIISQTLYERFPQMDEGGMTRIKVSLVAGTTLSKLADDIGIGKLIVFGSSERGTGKRGLASAMENVFEALVAALALDAGQEVARDWVLKTFAPLIKSSAANEPENPKSTLQELLQINHITPTYNVIDSSGPPHDRMFTAEVLAASEVLGSGSGHSKKDAENQAAKSALDYLQNKVK
jgi:ribonuclease-3